MIIVEKKFNDLTLEELYLILKIRQEVFIVEQKCFYLDCDDLDQKAIHFLGYINNSLVCYMRVLNNKMDSWILGRILVSKKNRNLGLGIKLIKKVLNLLDQKKPNYYFQMSAQTYLIDFYKKLGFQIDGDEYLDADIPHIKMIKNKK
tara:strand:- start:712 stop:1152 length:441 start_codon:yes stop_codon:yes gene_type:complete